MKKKITTLLALTVILTGLNFVQAEEIKAPNDPPKFEKVKPTPEQMQAHHQKKMQELYAYLNMTQEQIKKSDEIRLAAQAKMKPLIEKEKAKFKEIRDTRRNDDILIKNQDKKIDAIKQELKVINQDIRQIQQDERKAFKALLTDEQKTKLQEYKKEKMAAHRPPKGHRKHHGPMPGMH